MRVNKNADGRSIDEFDSVSLEYMSKAKDDDPIWEGYPYTSSHKEAWRNIALWVLQGRSLGLLSEGKLRTKELVGRGGNEKVQKEISTGRQSDRLDSEDSKEEPLEGGKLV